ncbi:MAG: hypothetical protein Q9167_001181 [Letrouitia subvulpina]
MEISPGEPAQTLHRDDFIWQQTHDDGGRQHYKVGSDVSLGLLVPGVDTTRDNGATMECQYLWWSKEEVDRWSLAAQKQAGYVLDNPFLGHCDETNPIDLFRADGTLQST